MKMAIRNLSPILVIIIASLVSGALLRDQLALGHQASHTPVPLQRYLDAKARRMMHDPRVAAILQQAAAASDPCASERYAVLLAEQDLSDAEEVLTLSQLALEQCEMMNP